MADSRTREELGIEHPYRQEFLRDDDAFDRVEFAIRALRILKPRGLTVAVFRGRGVMRVERGRAWDDADPNARWATVAIPAHASREDIAYTLAELAGLEREPYVLDALLAVRRGQ